MTAIVDLKMKLKQSLLAVAVLALFLQTGCSSNPKPKEELHIALDGEPASLNPQLATDIPLITVIRHLSEGLTRINPQGVIEPALAERIDVSEDGLHYHVVLRKTALWAKDKPVTAQDFARSYKQILTHKIDCKFADQLFVLKNAKAIYAGEKGPDELGLNITSEREFDIELEGPSPAFMYQLSTPVFFPVPEDIKDSSLSCGPYCLGAWERRKELTLEKNPLYWDAASVKIERIVCLVLPQMNTQFLMFNEGALDFSGSPMGILSDEAVHSPEAAPYLSHFNEPTINMLVFNTRSGPFSHLKMRQAFSLGIDRPLLIQEGIYTGKPATAFVPAEIMNQETSYFPAYDPIKAKALFEEALRELKVNREELPTIRLCFTAQGPHEKRCQAIEDNWFKLFGIHVKLHASERKILIPALQAGDFDIATASWVADFPDASNFLGIYYDSQGGRNFPGWQDENYRKEVDLGTAASDPKERQEHFLKAEKILMDNMVIAPLAFPASPYVVSKRLKGLYCNPMGYIDFRWASLEK